MKAGELFLLSYLRLVPLDAPLVWINPWGWHLEKSEVVRRTRSDHLWAQQILNSCSFPVSYSLPSHLPLAGGETDEKNYIKMGFTADGFLSKKTCSGPVPPDVVLLYFRDNTCLGAETHRQMWHKQKCKYFRWRMLGRRTRVGRENDAQVHVNMTGSQQRRCGTQTHPEQTVAGAELGGCWQKPYIIPGNGGI